MLLSDQISKCLGLQYDILLQFYFQKDYPVSTANSIKNYDHYNELWVNFPEEQNNGAKSSYQTTRSTQLYQNDFRYVIVQTSRNNQGSVYSSILRNLTRNYLRKGRIYTNKANELMNRSLLRSTSSPARISSLPVT